MIGLGPKADRLGLTSRFFNNGVHFLIQNLVLQVAPNSSRGANRYFHCAGSDLELPHVGNQRRLVLVSEFQFEHEIEILDGVFKRQQSAVVQVRWRILDAPQGERFDWTIGVIGLSVYQLRLIEALGLKVVHLLIHKSGWHMTLDAASFSKEHLLTQ